METVRREILFYGENMVNHITRMVSLETVSETVSGQNPPGQPPGQNPPGQNPP